MSKYYVEDMFTTFLYLNKDLLKDFKYDYTKLSNTNILKGIYNFLVANENGYSLNKESLYNVFNESNVESLADLLYRTMFKYQNDYSSTHRPETDYDSKAYEPVLRSISKHMYPLLDYIKYSDQFKNLGELYIHLATDETDSPTETNLLEPIVLYNDKPFPVNVKVMLLS